MPPGFSPGTRGQPGGRSRGPANSEAGTPRRQLEVGTLRARRHRVPTGPRACKLGIGDPETCRGG